MPVGGAVTCCWMGLGTGGAMVFTAGARTGGAMVLTGLRVGKMGCATVLRAGGGGGGTGLARCACRCVMYCCKLVAMLFLLVVVGSQVSNLGQGCCKRCLFGFDHIFSV